MGATTGIGWTGSTWNPVTGCSVVSPGCEHCYAAELSLRRGWTKKPWTAQNATENVVTHSDRLPEPLAWRQPRMVFSNSMSDLFHNLVPEEFIAQVFAVMGLRNIHTGARHTYQILTKRPERMRQVVSQLDPERLVELALELAYSKWGPVLPSRREWWKEYNRPFVAEAFVTWPLPNVWLGVSVEDQRRADERIPDLLNTPAAVRFISAEPLLGPIQLIRVGLGPWVHALRGIGLGSSEVPCSVPDGKLSWAIVGGESGRGHRPMRMEWLTSMVDNCRAVGTPVFVKQDSGPKPGKQGRIPDDYWIHEFPKAGQ